MLKPIKTRRDKPREGNLLELQARKAGKITFRRRRGILGMASRARTRASIPHHDGVEKQEGKSSLAVLLHVPFPEQLKGASFL